MILQRKKSDLPEYPMKKRFSETSIMSEYHSRKPYFIGVNDDGTACPNDSSFPNDEMWKKFELFLTPPSSPEHSLESDSGPPKLDPIVCALTSDAALTAALEGIEDLDVDLASCNFSDDEALHDPACPDKACDCDSAEQKLIKDCMWNGYGHNHKKRVASPVPAHSPCHANGCVDPRNIFPYPVGQPTCCENQRKRRFPSPVTPAVRHRPSAPTDGAETPSDSDEEIDVVTVESKQNINLLKPKASSGATVGAKIMGTLVSKENGELALVTTPSPNMAAGGTKMAATKLPELQDLKNNKDLDRGRPRNKIQVLCAANGNRSSLQEVAMLIDTQGGVTTTKDGHQVKLRVKHFPRPANDVTKRRNTTESACCAISDQAANTLMRLANPKSVMQRNNSVSPVPASGVKRRILSLDGISFSATTGARQYNTEYHKKEGATGPGGALKAAQENAISITAVRGKPKLKPAVYLPPKEKECDLAGTRTHIPTSPQSKRRRKEMIAASSGSDSEQIRAAHNVLERQRREGLRASFHTLRDNIPELQKATKTPKVNILNKARDYCVTLREKERSLISEKERLRRRNQRLELRLQRMRECANRVSSTDYDLDLLSDEEQSDTSSGLLSPESSLPPSLPPSPHVSTPSYYIASRIPTEDAASQSEVVFRLKSTYDANTRQIQVNQSKRKVLLSPAILQSCAEAKQIKYSADIQALLTGRQQKATLAAQNSGGLSDGYEEPYDSEDDAFRLEMAGSQTGHVTY